MAIAKEQLRQLIAENALTRMGDIALFKLLSLAVSSRC